MKILKLYLFSIALLVNSAYAAWSPSLTVADILVMGPEDGSGFIVVFQETVGVTEGTGTCSGTYHYFSAATKKGELMYSMLLAAKFSNKPVRASLVQAGSASRCVVRDIRLQ